MSNEKSFSSPLLLSITEEDRATMITIARHTLEALLLKKEFIPSSYGGRLEEKAGVFVTLKKHGELRGCVGYPDPVFPIAEAVRKSTISSAVMDPRFKSLGKDEIPELSIEIAVLGPREKFEPGKDKLEIGRHGTIVESAWTSGLLLPQVAVEEGLDQEQFLDATCIKAGMLEGCWKEDGVTVYIFEGLYFEG
ncbi:MAG: AmmeMemoRadiSam system protein A [Candidatus Thermoplasmatota archaeon]|jgi:AmmeMemoRadiSam system protein A|nr:AmmeMemoRadiSam system protein A [Candidatus Thermoplasmatota archaeon]